MFGDSSIVAWSCGDDDECDFDCPENCSCYFCVGVCTWDCKVDDSTCKTGDYN